ncbi:MAG: hypothetical protein ACK528_09740 [Alphaproteobacteria bacterium]|jgi:hypothetical protein
MTGWHWLFGGEVYYPSGGMNDLLGIYPTLDAAKAAATEAVQAVGIEWWQIVDATSGVVVLRSECKPYGGE